MSSGRISNALSRPRKKENEKRGGSSKLDYGAASTLPGIPMATPMDAVERPSLMWILEFLHHLRQSLSNDFAVMHKAGSQQQDDTFMTEDRQKTIEGMFFSAIQKEREQKGEDSTGEGAVDVPDSVPDDFSLADITQEIMGAFVAGDAKLSAMEPTKDDGSAPTVQDYKDLFQKIPLPDIVETFETDAAFSRMRLAGLNPMSITCITKVELVNIVGDRISDDVFNATLGTSGDSVERAGVEKRLCVTNYKELLLTNPNMGDVTFVTSPIAVFAEPISGDDVIKPVAIQLGQDRIDSEIIFANTSDVYRWRIAKHIVQVADVTFHTFVQHVGFTHLVMEVFSIAVQRNFSQTHPLNRLLLPHIEGTNFTNQGAGTRGLDPAGRVMKLFADNEEARTKSIQTLLVNNRVRFDFENRMPDIELKRRNVEKLKKFPYRDDALLIWKALLDWAEEYVNLYYSNDQDVVDDEELADWSQEIIDHGHIINFPAPRTKAELVRILGMVMFLASAQHACMNFSQKDYFIFAPSAAGAIFDNLPTNIPATEDQFVKQLPPIDYARLQLSAANIAGNVHHLHLGEYQYNTFPYCGTLESKAGPALEKFRAALKVIETKITEANKERGYLSYEYLLPSKIPVSINA